MFLVKGCKFPQRGGVSFLLRGCKFLAGSAVCINIVVICQEKFVFADFFFFRSFLSEGLFSPLHLKKSIIQRSAAVPNASSIIIVFSTRHSSYPRLTFLSPGYHTHFFLELALSISFFPPECS